MKSYYNSWPWNNPQISSNFGQLDAYDTTIVIGLEQNNNLATKLTYILKDYIIIFFTSYGVKEPRLKVWEIPWVAFFPRSFYKKLKINYFDIWHILTQKTCRICYYYTVNRHYKVEEDMEVKVNEAVFFAIFSLSTFQFCYFHIIKILVTSMATILRQLKVEIRPPLFFKSCITISCSVSY